MRTTTILACALALAAGAARAAEGDVPLQELPPQTLDKGQCALALWTRTTPARRVFMAFSTPAAAKVQAGGRTLTLPRTAWDGEAVFGHYPRQTYAGSGWTLRVTVEFDARSGLVGGAVAPSGAIELTDAQGLSLVVPVAGLVACQA
jgi:hypothetical protein